MANASKQNITARKKGLFLELSFEFNSRTKDDYIVINSAKSKFFIMQADKVTDDLLKEVENYWQSSIGEDIQDTYNSITSEKTGRKVRSDISTNAPIIGNSHNNINLWIELSDKLQKAAQGFQDKYSDIFYAESISLDFKQKLRSPNPSLK